MIEITTRMQRKVLILVVAVTTLAVAQGAPSAAQQTPQSAAQLAMDMYHSCLKDLSISCVRPKALHWFNTALQQPEVRLTERLSIVRTTQPEASGKSRALNADEQMFENIDQYLGSHALRIQAPEYFRSSEARALVPDFLMENPLTQGGIVPLATANEGK